MTGALEAKTAGALVVRSGDERLLRQLRTGAFEAEVHSVFRRVVNLVSAADGALCSLAAASVDDAPDTLIVTTSSFDGLGLRRQARVRGDGSRLVIEPGIEVELGVARAWCSTMPTLDASKVPLARLEDLIVRTGVAGGVLARGKPGDRVARETQRLLDAGVRGLRAALSHGDLAAAYANASGLIGLGPGLTPSGDDFIVGLAAACAVRDDRVTPHREVLRAAVADSAGRTNRISYAALTHAAVGRVRERIVRFARSLAVGEDRAITVCAQRVLAIGATSGTDIMLGMLAGLSFDRVD